jgi:hypothetical protein
MGSETHRPAVVAQKSGRFFYPGTRRVNGIDQLLRYRAARRIAANLPSPTLLMEQMLGRLIETIGQTVDVVSVEISSCGFASI